MTRTPEATSMSTVVPIRDDSDVIEALGDGPALSEQQFDLLEILLDPRNDPSECASDRLGMLNELVFSSSDLLVANDIAAILCTYFDRERRSSFEFELIFNQADYGYSTYNVMTRLEPDFWLSVTEESKYLEPRRYETTPLRTVLGIAETILADHTRVIAKYDELVAATVCDGSVTVPYQHDLVS